MITYRIRDNSFPKGTLQTSQNIIRAKYGDFNEASPAVKIRDEKDERAYPITRNNLTTQNSKDSEKFWDKK